MQIMIGKFTSRTRAVKGGSHYLGKDLDLDFGFRFIYTI